MDLSLRPIFLLFFGPKCDEILKYIVWERSAVVFMAMRGREVNVVLCLAGVELKGMEIANGSPISFGCLGSSEKSFFHFHVLYLRFRQNAELNSIQFS